MQLHRLHRLKAGPACVTHLTRIIFTTGVGLHTFAANGFNTQIALSKVRVTKWWLANSSRYLNRLSLHAGFINYILFTAVVVNKPKHGDIRSSVCNASTDLVNSLFRGFTKPKDQHHLFYKI